MAAELSKMLEDSGLVENNDGKLELTPRAIRRIANQALSDLFAKLAKLGELKAAGVLTEEEFAAEKAKILA